MRRIETDRAGFLAPGFRLEAIAGQHRVEQRADGEYIRAFVDLLAAVDFRRGVSVIENRIRLQLVVVGNVVEAGHLDPAIGAERDRLGTDIVEAQSASMNETYR